MPYKLRTFECAGCGQLTQRRGPSGSKQRCVICGIRRSADAAMSLHTHSGEFYQRWADGMERAARLGRQLADLGAEIDSIG